MSGEGVLCAGTMLVDVAKVIDAYPALDHLATIEQVSLSTGGPGLNMAVDLRMLGAALPTNMEVVPLAPHPPPRPARPGRPSLDSMVNNEPEAGALTGIDAPAPAANGPADWPALEAMALGLIEHGVSALAVVHVPAGCVAAAPGGRTWRQGSVRLPREHVRMPIG